MPEIHCWLQHLNGSAIVLPPDGALLGQAPSSVFRQLDGRIADRHARIEMKDGRVFLSPRDGAPCALNGERLLHPKALRDGDWISLAPGQLFRVCIRPWTAPRWLVEVGAQRSWISADTEEDDPDGSLLRLSPEGLLLLRLRQPARRGAQDLPADGRAWALAEGDVVHLGDGQELRVLRGPQHPAPPMAPLAPGGWVRRRPPERILLSAEGRVVMHYPQEVLSASLGESAALARALLVQPGALVPLDALGGDGGLRRLRERLVAAGVDGFSLIRRHADGAALPLSDTEVALDAVLPPQPAAPTERRWWLCTDGGSRIQLDAAGVLLGRHEECEVRCRVPYVHRHHAVLQVACSALWLIPLGRHPVYLDSSPIHRERELRAGAELRIVPEARMWVEQHPVPLRPVPAYTLRLPDGALRTIRQAAAPMRGLLPEASGGCLVRIAGKLYAVITEDGVCLNGKPLRPRQAVRLSVGDRLRVGDEALEVVSLAPGGTPPRLTRIATQSFARRGRLLVRTEDGQQHRIGLRGLVFQLLLLLLEAAVGSRLRGVIQTQPSSDELLEEHDSLPRGAMRLHDLRLELVASQRLSLAATRALITELQAALVRGGLDGHALLVLGGSWVCFTIDLDCTVDLYR